MLREVRNAALCFALAFLGYGALSSSYLASFGFTYEQGTLGYVAFSSLVYVGLGVVGGGVFGAASHAIGRGVRGRLGTTAHELAFHLVAATAFFYLLHAYLRVLSGYVFLHWDKSDRGPQLVALLALGGACAAVLVAARSGLARVARGGPALAGALAAIALLVPVSVTSHLGCTASPEEATRGSVFVFSIDTLRADHLALYGHPRVRTPTIDAIARDGVTFLNAYSTSPFTWPSLSSFLTGRFTLHHGVRRNGTRLPAEEVTLVELFRRRGYETAGISDIGLRWMGFDQGFERLLRYDAGLFDIQPFRRMLPIDPRFSNWFAVDGVITSSLPQTLTALRWLRTEENLDRAFLWFHFYDDAPHTPYTSPEPFSSMYVPPGNQSAYDGNRPFVHGLNVGKTRATPDDRERIRALYEAEITWCDRQLRALVAQLKRRGLYEDSTVVIFADHGEMFGRRGYWTHGEFLYNSQIKVPLIIKPPRGAGFRSAARVEQPVSLTDLLPTLAEMYDLDAADAAADGMSLVPFLEEEGTVSAYRFWHYAETLVYARSETGLETSAEQIGFSVLTDEWKSISVPALEEYHLYERGDAGERDDVRDTSIIAQLEKSALEYFGVPSVEALVAFEEDAVPEPTRQRLEALGYIVE